MTMVKMLLCGLTALIGFYSSLALADGNTYQIEAIIFAQNTPTDEVFDQTSSQIGWPPDLTELSVYSKPEQTLLDDAYAALSRDSAYQPISHIAWVQQMNKGEQAAPVHIQGVKNGLNGYIQLHYIQGLQMTVDLELNSGSGVSSGETLIYRLNEKRPIKLNEIYYFDHPKFGVVVKINLLPS
jgi:hypothetical protein